MNADQNASTHVHHDIHAHAVTSQPIPPATPATAPEPSPEPPTAWTEIKRGMRAMLPALVGIVPLGLLLGAQATTKGLSVVEVPLLTGLNFAGGSEFAALALWTSPPHLLLIAGITLLINSRFLLMGAALAPFLRHLTKRQALASLYLMSDACWALGLSDARRRAAAGITPAFSLPYYLGASAILYVSWVVVATIGALCGPLLGDARSLGLHMAFPAIFIVLIRSMWKGLRAARPWVVSLVVAASTYLFVPGAWYMVAGAISGMLAAYVLAGKA